MLKKIIISWLIVLVLVFSIFYFSLIKNGFVLLLFLILLPLMPFLTIFLDKKTMVKSKYYIYGY